VTQNASSVALLMLSGGVLQSLIQAMLLLLQLLQPFRSRRQFCLQPSTSHILTSSDCL
jgi:hypothetical protein